MKKKLLSVVFALVSISIYAQVGIGTENPNSSAVLELSSNNKGLLLPRIALLRTTSASPLNNHVAGMLVYNTATKNNVYPGYYLNNGSEWVRSTTSVKDLEGMSTPSSNNLIVYAEGGVDLFYNEGAGWTDNIVDYVTDLTENINVENAYNSVTGLFTVPEDGLYYITGKVTLGITNNSDDVFDGTKGKLVAYLNVDDVNSNNTTTLDQSWLDIYKGVKNSPKNFSGFVSSLAPLKKGDKISLKFKTNNASDLSVNTASAGLLLRRGATTFRVYKL